MTFTRTQAKTLCDASEMKLYDLAQPAKIESLSLIELKKYVTHSRTVRDKWQDVSRKQRRKSQDGKGHRQTADNSRSHDKYLLFDQLHNQFAERLNAVEAGEVNVRRGRQPTGVDRAKRRAVASAERMAVRDDLRTVKKKLNKANRLATAKKASSRGATATGEKTDSVQSSSSQVSKKKRAGTSSAKKPAGTTKKPPNKQTSKPTVSRARKRLLAKIDKIAESAQNEATAKTATEKGKRVGDSGATTSKLTARNRTPHNLATQKSIAKGGGVRQKAHIASANKRSQARRDSK